MDQRPNDRIPPRPDEPLRDDVRPARTSWDRVTRTEEGAWNYIPLLLVAALIAIGAWLLMAADRTGPTSKTTENVPNATAPARPTPNPSPSPNPSAAPQPSTPAPAPAPATKP
jgi:hypothetical protein